MFLNIKISEAAIFAEIMTIGLVGEDGTVYPPESNEEALKSIELIDNMLSVMKSKSLLNRKRGVKKMLDGLIAIHVGDKSIIPGASNNHLLR